MSTIKMATAVRMKDPKIVALLIIVVAIWGFLGGAIYYNYFRKHDVLTYQEIGECLEAKHNTVDQLIDCLAKHCSTDAPQQLIESSARASGGQAGVSQLLAALREREGRVGKRYDPIHGPMLNTFADADVYDIRMIKPEESTGSTAWGAGGTYRGWYIIIAKPDKILTWIPTETN